MVWALLIVVFVVPSPKAQANAPYEMPVQADANGYEMIINLPARELHLYRYGVPVKTYPIGVGHIVSPSKLGSTQIVNRVIHPTYYPPDWYVRGLEPIPPGPDNPVGTRWLGLGWSGYGIHGTNRPESIGTAASAGCIRMLNQDVEELADLVGVGTPVTFVYEPVEVFRDGITGRAVIRIHRDIYRAGSLSVDEVVKLLAQRNALPADLSQEGLAYLLGEAAGETRLVPTQLPITLAGTELLHAGFSIGPRRYVSLSALADQLGEELNWETNDGICVNGLPIDDGITVAGAVYVSPETAAAVLGLELDMGVGPKYIPLVNYHPIEVTFLGQRLPFRAHLEHSWVMLPVAKVASIVGVQVDMTPDQGHVLMNSRPVFSGRMINGDLHLGHDRLASLLDISIVWDRDQYVVRLDP